MARFRWGRAPELLDQIDLRDEAFIDGFRRRVASPLKRLCRGEVRGLDDYPEGPALVVGNHNGGTLTPDTFIFGDAVIERFGVDHLPYGLAHEFPMHLPGVGQMLRRLGAVRANHENARRLFAAGRKVMVYPGGDVEALRAYKDRNRIIFDGRCGYVRLALRQGVPIAPVVSAGAHAGFVVLHDGRAIAKALRLDRLFRLKALPISLSVPWGLTVGVLPPYWPLKTRIVIKVLPPIVFDREGEDAASDEAYVRSCDERVRREMQRCLRDLAVEVERDAAGHKTKGSPSKD